MGSCRLASFGLSAKKLRQLGLSLAFIAEPFGQNDTVRFIKMIVESTVAAFNALDFLPQAVGGMSAVGLSEHLINAAALDEAVEQVLIGSLVDTAATLVTCEISFDLLEPMMLWLGRCVLLLVK